MDEIERKKWLLSIGEDESFDLPVSDWYDRIRLKRQILAEEHLNTLGYTGVAEKHKDAVKEKYGALMANGYWMRQ